jgi:RNA polymerase sigma factor (sigma-70 family)
MKVEKRQSSSCTDEADRELLRRYQGGDESAFDELLEVHSAYVRYWVSLALKQAPWAQADDLRQEAHWGFYEAAKKYKFSRKGNFHALARIRAWGKMFDSPEVRIVNRILYDNHSEVMAAQDRLMKKLERRPSYQELAEEANLSVKQVETAIKVAPFPSTLDENDEALSLEDSDTSQLLSDAIALLSSDQAEVITRRYAGDKFWEIAKALGKSEDAVKKLHERAKKKLKGIIQGKGIRKDET